MWQQVAANDHQVGNGRMNECDLCLCALQWSLFARIEQRRLEQEWRVRRERLDQVNAQHKPRHAADQTVVDKMMYIAKEQCAVGRQTKQHAALALHIGQDI